MDKMFNFINFLKKYHLINNPNMDHYEVSDNREISSKRSLNPISIQISNLT